MSNLDWDSPMNEENRDYETLPQGEYRFAVTKLEKSVSKGEKTKGAPLASLQFSLFAKDDVNYEHQIGIGFDHLVRHTSCDWKVCAFFTAIAERKHGEVITPNWEMVPAATGRAIFVPETYNGKTAMKVDTYLEPEELNKTPDSPNFG